MLKGDSNRHEAGDYRCLEPNHGAGVGAENQASVAEAKAVGGATCDLAGCCCKQEFQDGYLMSLV